MFCLQTFYGAENFTQSHVWWIVILRGLELCHTTKIPIGKAIFLLLSLLSFVSSYFNYIQYVRIILSDVLSSCSQPFPHCQLAIRQRPLYTLQNPCLNESVHSKRKSWSHANITIKQNLCGAVQSYLIFFLCFCFPPLWPATSLMRPATFVRPAAMPCCAMEFWPEK